MTDLVAAVEARFRAEGMKGEREEIRRFAEVAVKVCERELEVISARVEAAEARCLELAAQFEGVGERDG